MIKIVKRVPACGWVAIVVFAVFTVGCRRESHEANAFDKEVYVDAIENARSFDRVVGGKLVLGSPSLTSGIPGEGSLSQNQLERWLSDDTNHAPLNVVLPKHLQSGGDSSPSLPEANPLTRAKIELGRQLFFDKRLSGFGTFSCGTCHQPKQSYSSYQVMPEVGRNALPVFNRILSDEQFWDGRAVSLEAQPESPIKNPFEMNSSKEKSTANIAAIPGYRLQFERIFGEVSFENICKAIACFERVLVTDLSPWDQSNSTEEADQADPALAKLSPAAERGASLFFSDRLACSDCHSGPNLTDESYHNLGTHVLDDYSDRGRAQVSGEEEFAFAFKTPSLRNVAMTPPYMHNGVFRTLEEVVEFFDAGGHHSDEPVPSENGQTESAHSDVLQPLSLTVEEKADLVEFLKSLTSPLPHVETGRLPE